MSQIEYWIKFLRPKPNENRVLVLSLGSDRFVGIEADPTPASVKVVRFKEVPRPEGFLRGEVAHLEKALASVSQLIEGLELGAEALDLPTYVLLSGPHLKMSRFSSSTYYSGYPRVVTSHEIRQVIEQTRTVAPLSLDEWILQVVPESYWVNDLQGVEDPTGMEAQRLAVTLQIFTTAYGSFRNLARVIESLELNIQGYYPEILTLPAGVLTGRDQEGETVVVEFSDEATHLVHTRGGKIVQAKSLNLGGNFVSSKIAETWQLNLEDAQRLTERFGSLEEGPPFGEELIPLVERDGRPNHQIKRSEFHQAFLRFGDDFLSQIEKELRRLLSEEKAGPSSFVLTGSGAKLEGLVESFGRRFSAPVRLGTSRYVEAAQEILIDPAWASTIGLLHLLADQRKEKRGKRVKEGLLERTLFQVKEWLAAYF
jgi:cell division protein FtsA